MPIWSPSLPASKTFICRLSKHMRKKKKKLKKKRYIARDWRQELTLGARMQLVGRVNVCSGNDARRQEAMSGVRWAVTLVKKGRKLLSPLLSLSCPSHKPLRTSVPNFNERETPGRCW